ncbi:MAG: response regulator [Magnetococcales bacterium]|nr:response regulator [Magnetococcales bacterium]
MNVMRSCSSLDPALACHLVEEAAFGWIVLDAATRVLVWNGWMEQASGIGKGRILGQLWRDFFPGAAHSRLDRAIADALKSGLPALLTSRLNAPPLPLTTPHGLPMQQTIHVKPVEHGESGRHCLIQIQDVTEVVLRDQRLRERARVASQAKGVVDAENQVKNLFLAHLGHALRTPLSTILGMVELLQHADDLYKVRRQAGVIHHGAQALQEILDDVRDYSLLMAGALTPEWRPLDPGTMFGELRDTFSIRARAQEIDFLSEIPADLPTGLLGDPERIQLALAQLLNHALRTTPRGEIRLTVRVLTVEADRVRLGCDIRDTGSGLDAQALQQLFSPVAAPTASASLQGSGLGPAIAHGVIERLGGTITVESAPGRGTLFRVEFPLARPAAAGAATDRRFANTLKILVVEDDEVNREVTRGMLKRLGIVADLAENGAEGLDRLKATRYDLVFMDCQMPVMDGLTATQLFRAAEEAQAARRTPVVALTAQVMKGDRERCLKAGMDDYLTKPVRGEMLRQTILRWVSG